MTRPFVLIALAGSVAMAASAQQPAIPIRPLGPAVATSTVIGNVFTIRPLSDGQVLVNNTGTRRLLLFDATLANRTIVADTTAKTGNAYGQGLTGMMPFTHDSTLIQDQTTGTFLVLDPAGKIARLIKPPQPLAGANVVVRIGLLQPLGNPLGYDMAGHLLYGSPPPIFGQVVGPEFLGDTVVAGPDSLPVLRMEVVSRHIDTIAMLQAPVTRGEVSRRVRTSTQSRPMINPIPTGDDWTVLGDGTVAIIRARDYRLDLIAPDGHMTVGPSIPVERALLTMGMKTALIDSLRRLQPAAPPAPDGMPLFQQPRRYVDPADLPDGRPVFATGATRADRDGHVWVRLNLPTPPVGGAVYDVIARNGQRVDRVQLPAGATLLDFGPGVVYLSVRVNGALCLAKAPIR